MKRILPWLIAFSALVLVVSLGVMGVKILDHDYEFITEAYIAQASWIVLIASIIILQCSRKCPHCGRHRQPGGQYCPHCGKKIES